MPLYVFSEIGVKRKKQQIANRVNGNAAEQPFRYPFTVKLYYQKK